MSTDAGAAIDTGPSTLGELLLAFSTVTSAGLGFGTDHGVRTCYIGMHIATALELPPERAADVYYAALAKDGGCTCGATQMATFLGSDEREALADLATVDPNSDLQMLRWMFRHAGRGSGPLTRARRTIGALIHGERFEREVALEECEVAQQVGVRLGLSEEATLALTACNERWDGKGKPRGLAGDAIPLTARIINLGAAVEISGRLSSPDTAVELVRRGSGTVFDPAIAGAFLAVAQRDAFWQGLEDEGLRDRVLTLEPRDGGLPAGHDVLDRFAEVLADLVDLKRPGAAGHSRRVAELAVQLAGRLDVSGGDRATLRRAALIHDVGLMTVSSHELTRGGDSAAYRAHPLAAAQLLEGLPALREACRLAVLHHERIDGSGWPAGAAAAQQPLTARILASACAFDEGQGDRSPADSLRLVNAEPGHDPQVLGALADLIGVPRESRPAPRPAGLTEREVEVLRLAAAGHSVREIARRLVISHHTARHHLESTYSKIGCSTRAAAVLFAAEHGLLD